LIGGWQAEKRVQPRPVLPVRVAAMRVSNADCSRANRWRARSPTPTGFLELFAIISA
jgi:hypothetical protein